jgi:hypothetical protein
VRVGLFRERQAALEPDAGVAARDEDDFFGHAGEDNGWLWLF